MAAAVPESSPLLQNEGNGLLTPASPSSLVRPGTESRPKPARSVTFDANPVSRTIDLSPVPSPPAYESRLSHVSARHRVASTANTPVMPAYSSSEPTAYGSIPPSPNAKVRRAAGSATGSSAAPPMLAAINNRLRRRNSSGSASFPGQHRQQLQQMQQAAAVPKIGPQRTSKNAQKLKLLPNPDFGDEGPEEESGRDVYSQYTRIKDPTARRDAAFLGKADRGRLPRVTAYCTANRYQMDGLMHFLKGRSKTRGANPKLIDECVYTPYNYNYGKSSNSNSNSNGNDAGAGQTQPLSRQSPAGRRNLLQEQEWEPEQDAHLSTIPEASFRERRHSADEVDLNHHDLLDLESGPVDESDATHTRLQRVEEEAVGSPPEDPVPFYNGEPPAQPTTAAPTQDRGLSNELVSEYEDGSGREREHERVVDLDIHVRTPEVFLFDYGVVVIWGMSEGQEQRFLKELARFETEKLAPDDVEAEFFNFYYTREYQARIYNDFIALRDDRSGSYMAKLAISHALAQSVKTSLFEELIASTIDTCKDIPTQIAMTGTIALSRSQINMQIGELFILRINIHLNGSVLDTPELFWVEPQLEPMYQAVRSYLEMDQRVSLLTQRLDVIADLLAVLKEQLSHGHGEKLEWIVIILIAAEIFVAVVNIVVDLYVGD